MKRLALLVFFLSAILSPVKTGAQTKLTLSPVTTKLSATPGSVQRVIINLKNNSNKPITVTVTPRDFQIDTEKDEPFLLTSNTSAYSLANWLTDSNLKKQITIPANQTIEYPAIFRVPFAVLPKTYFGAVQFTQADEINIGSFVFITIGSPKTHFTIDNLAFGQSTDASKPHGEFTTLLTNTSDGIIEPSFKARITNNQGKTIAEIENNQVVSLLPQSTRKYSFSPLSELPKEHLTATLTVVDQNGVSADKSIQIDMSQSSISTPNEEQIDPKDYSRMLMILSVVLIGAIIGALAIVRGRSEKQAQD